MEAARLKDIFKKAVPEIKRVQEIRVRAGKPVFVFMDGQEFFLLEKGLLGRWGGTEQRDAVIADQTLIKEILGIFSRHSLYAFEDEVRQGFLTIEGGHRVGISGKTVLEGQWIRTIKDISGLNIRLAHQKIGCADRILPFLYENGCLKNTLFLSPPGAGKTTLLRDAVRQISNGNVYGEGMEVSVVDERSEIGASFKGIPQCDLGIRTDVMDACPKALGMLMMIRSMAPRVVAVDEIGTREDLEALRDVMNCGCRILATVHGNQVEDLAGKPVLSEMAREKMFDRYVVLTRTPGPGTVTGIYNGEFMRLWPEN